MVRFRVIFFRTGMIYDPYVDGCRCDAYAFVTCHHPAQVDDDSSYANILLKNFLLIATPIIKNKIIPLLLRNIILVTAVLFRLPSVQYELQP